MKIKSTKEWREGDRVGYVISTDCGNIFVCDPVNLGEFIMDRKHFSNIDDCTKYICKLEAPT